MKTINIKSNNMKTAKIIVAFLVSSFAFTACDNNSDSNSDNPAEPEKSKPTIDKIEIGSGNNEIGTIGRDFHFNAEIVAADKIASAQIKIVQISTEKYSKVWSHEINWSEYVGVKNTTIHKHFLIPTDAPEGKYFFIIIIKDQNGTTLEVKKTLNIYAKENLPIDPSIVGFHLYKNKSPFYVGTIYSKEGDSFKTGDKISSYANISQVKGDGIMYFLLINKNAEHLPESVDQIDFSKVIVMDVFEHKGQSSLKKVARKSPLLTIGALKDNNVPSQYITGTKAWATGTYIYMVLYKNTTYNINLSKSIGIPINL